MATKAEIARAVRDEYRTRYWIAYKFGMEAMLEAGEYTNTGIAFNAPRYLEYLTSVGAIEEIASRSGIEIDRDHERQRAIRMAGEMLAYEYIELMPMQVASVLATWRVKVPADLAAKAGLPEGNLASWEVMAS